MMVDRKMLTLTEGARARIVVTVALGLAISGTFIAQGVVSGPRSQPHPFQQAMDGDTLPRGRCCSARGVSRGAGSVGGR